QPRAGASFHMLQRKPGLHPGVAPALIDGMARDGKAGIGEGAHSDGDQIGKAGELPIDRRAAIRAEMEGEEIAAVRHAVEGGGPSLDLRDLGARETRGGAEDAARPPLAVRAVTDRDADRLALAGEAELSAAAMGFAGHGHASDDLEGADSGRVGAGRME